MEAGRVYKISVTEEDESGTLLTGLVNTCSIVHGPNVDPGVKLSEN